MLHLGDNIRYIRLLCGLTQTEFGEKIGVTRRKEIRRKFEKVITSYKIVIYHLTPFFERTDDIPALINRKTNKDEN